MHVKNRDHARALPSVSLDNNQYLVTFAASGGSTGKFVSVKLKTEVTDVDLMTYVSAFGLLLVAASDHNPFTPASW
jgi:hypothetical protein